MAKVKRSNKLKQLLIGVVVALNLVGSSLGGYTFYKFYLQPTGVTFKDGGHQVNRATLVDMALKALVEMNRETK